MSKNNKTKITILSVIASCLLIFFCFLVYITFIADADLKRMGYTPKEITILKSYNIDDEVTSYNQSLLYALNSNEFDENNIDYYLLFNSKMDLTRIINSLASMYSVNDIKVFKNFLSIEEIESLIEIGKINNIEIFRKFYTKGYDLTNSLDLTNDFPTDSINSLLSLEVLEHPNYYKDYLNKGYDDDTICAIYNYLGASAFNNLHNINYYEQLYQFIINNNFDISKLPRYMIYLSSTKKATVESTLKAVNDDNDLASSDSLDYISFYSKPNKVTEESVTMLVNPKNVIADSFIPSNLVEVDANYRYNNQMLKEEVAESFIEMANALYNDLQINILAYNNYISYASKQAEYNQAVVDSYNDEAIVVKYMLKPGCDEHQTGLAIDIAEKGKTCTDLVNSEAYSWLSEHCHEYGFIMRYPKGKESITMFTFVPYHYRYVGKDVSSIIAKYNWTLEEYNYLYE